MQEFLQLANLGIQIYKLLDTNSGSSIVEVLKVVDANLKQLNRQNEALNLQINKLIDENNQLKKEQSSSEKLNIQNQKLNFQVDQLFDANHRLEKQKCDLESRISSMLQACKSINESAKEENIENQNLKLKIDNFAQENKQLKAEKGVLRLRIKQLANENNQLKEKAKKIEENISAITDNPEELANLKIFLMPRKYFYYHKDVLLVIKKFKKIENIYEEIQKIKKKYHGNKPYFSKAQLSEIAIAELQTIQDSEDYWDVVMFFCRDPVVKSYTKSRGLWDNPYEQHDEHSYFPDNYDYDCDRLEDYYDRLFDEDWDNLDSIIYFENFYSEVENFVWKCTWRFICSSGYINVNVDYLEIALNKAIFLFAELKIFNQEDLFFPRQEHEILSLDPDIDDLPF
jgi:hypothetical protein